MKHAILNGKSQVVGLARFPSENTRPITEVQNEVNAWKFDKARADAIREIDLAAHNAMEGVTSPSAAQQQVYQLKADQAQAALNSNSPVASDYPALAGEIRRAGGDVVLAAQVIIAARNAWTTYGFAADNARLAGKDAVAAASDAGEVETALVEALAAIQAIPVPS